MSVINKLIPKTNSNTHFRQQENFKATNEHLLFKSLKTFE